MDGKIYLDQYYGLHYPSDAKHTDGAPDEIWEVMHKHWATFPPVHPFYQHFFGLLFILLWIVSICGNSLVIFIFLKTKSLRTPSNMLIVSLAVSDLCMFMTNATPVIINIFVSRFWCWGAKACEIYGFLGAIFGCTSLILIIFIGFDRYNVIVKGMSGTRVTSMKAIFMILFAYGYSTAVSLPPLLNVWGAFRLEGLLVTCSFDYLTDTWNNYTYSMFIIFFMYCLPLIFIVYFYSQIVAAVVSHERALKAQAKKMNVDSLRSNVDSNAESAEVRIAKVAITNVTLWFVAWTPYCSVVTIGQFIGAQYVTPLNAQLPSFLAKTASVFNPIVYAISHPKYREALMKECPCLGILERTTGDDTKTEAAETKT